MVISRLRTLIVILLLVNIAVTSDCVNGISECRSECVYTPVIEIQPSYEYPPFVPPPANTSTVENGSVWVDGIYLYWRLFSPNSSIPYQDPKFQIAFDIWWEHTPGGHIVTLSVEELDGGSAYYENYGMLTNYTTLVNDSEGDFLHYGVWSNSSYFYMNMTNYLGCSDAVVHDATVKVTLTVHATTYHTLCSFNILRDVAGPYPEIIHTSYNQSSKELYLNWGSTDFHINVTDENEILYGRVSVHFTNRRTGLPEEILFWESYNIRKGELTEITLQQDLLEEFIVNASRSLENPLNMNMEILLLDEFLNTDSFTFQAYINRPDSITTATTTADPWAFMTPILPLMSVAAVALVVILVGFYKRKD